MKIQKLFLLIAALAAPSCFAQTSGVSGGGGGVGNGLGNPDGNIGAIAPAATLSLTPTASSRSVTSAAFDQHNDLDLDAAINSYQSIVSGFDSRRAEAANAIYQLAECYRKLGRNEEADVQYNRILREFPDQTSLVYPSRKALGLVPRPNGIPTKQPARPGMKQIKPSPAINPFSSEPTFDSSPVSSTEGRVVMDEKDLLNQEIKEQQALVTRADTLRQNGFESDANVLSTKRELLGLEERLAAKEARDRQKELLNEEISLLKTELDQAIARHQQGTASNSEVSKVKRELLQVQQKLAVLDELSPSRSKRAKGIEEGFKK